MIIIPIICLSLIWAAFIYGFAREDMNMGLAGRAFSGLSHAACVTLALGAFGLLMSGTILVIKEAVS